MRFPRALIPSVGLFALAACGSDSKGGSGSDAGRDGGGGQATGASGGTAAGGSSGTGGGANGGGGGTSGAATGGSTSGGSGTNTGGTSTGGTSTGGTSGSGTGGGTNTGGGPGSPFCSRQTDGGTSCPVGQFCNAPGCGLGTCQKIPLTATETPSKSAVCGCDGEDYFNQTVAATHGMAVRASGECPNPTTCGGIAGLQCPSGESCGYEVTSIDDCTASDLGGRCQFMPASCFSQILTGPKTRACGAGQCATECDLVKQGSPFYPDNGCPQ